MSEAEERGLNGVATGDLVGLLGLVSAGKVRCPVTRVGLSSHNLEHLGPCVGLLEGLDRAGTEAVLRGVLAERELGQGAAVSLVWTGPEGPVSMSRDTAVVVQELFSRAERSVLVAGFSFDHGKEILGTLHEAMGARGVKAALFLNIPRIEVPGTGEEEYVAGWVGRFLEKNWPFGDPRPDVYYDPRTVGYGSMASLHAKCVVVDDCRALVTSANFTDRGQSRNIEVGVLVEDEGFARGLATQWWGAVKAGLLGKCE